MFAMRLQRRRVSKKIQPSSGRACAARCVDTLPRALQQAMQGRRGGGVFRKYDPPLTHTLLLPLVAAARVLNC